MPTRMRHIAALWRAAGRRPSRRSRSTAPHESVLSRYRAIGLYRGAWLAWVPQRRIPHPEPRRRPRPSGMGRRRVRARGAGAAARAADAPLHPRGTATGPIRLRRRRRTRHRHRRKRRHASPRREARPAPRDCGAREVPATSFRVTTSSDRPDCGTLVFKRAAEIKLRLPAIAPHSSGGRSANPEPRPSYDEGGSLAYCHKRPTIPTSSRSPRPTSVGTAPSSRKHPSET